VTVSFSRRILPHTVSYLVKIGVGIDHGIALSYRLDDPRFESRHRVQIGCGAYPASYPMVTRGFFPGGKAAVP